MIRYLAVASLFFLVLFFPITVLGAVHPQPRPVFPFPIQEFKLSNGFRVFAVPFDSPGVVAFVTVVRSGARDEVEPGCSGFAHFFEHMMFRGTKTFSNAARERELMLMGAESNAFTSDDCTVYHILGGADALERIMQIESDRFRHLSYSEEDLRTEATVILGEYQKDASSPYTRLEETMRGTAFSRHTYQHTVIGFLDDIKRMPGQYEYSRKFYARSYSPGRCSLVVAGDIDVKKIERLAQQYYGSWKPAGTEEITPVEEPPQTGEKSVHVSWKQDTLPFVYLGYRVPAFSDRHPDPAALEVLAQLVFSSISPLYQKLVLEEQKVEFISGSYDRHRDPYLFTVMARVKKNTDLEMVRNAIDNALASAATHLPEAERLEEVKSNLRYGFGHQLKTPLGVAFSLAEFLWLSGNPQALNRHYRNLQNVRPIDVLRVARRYFQSSNRSVVTLSNGDQRP